MAKDSKSGEGELKVTPNYEKVLYTPERVGKWMNGEISLQELTAISGPEMGFRCTSRASMPRRAPCSRAW